jgi:hypothetical protein
VAIFAPLDARADRISIFVEGLSGQYIERPKVQGPGAAKPAAEKPAAGPAEEKAAPAAAKKGEESVTGGPGKPTAKEIAALEAASIRLRKTLELQYKIPSDDLWINLDKPVFAGKRWTWR